MENDGGSLFIGNSTHIDERVRVRIHQAHDYPLNLSSLTSQRYTPPAEFERQTQLRARQSMKDISSPNPTQKRRDLCDVRDDDQSIHGAKRR